MTPQITHKIGKALAMIAALAVFVAHDVRAQATPEPMRVVMLGTGTPNADPDRSGPAVAIVKGDRAILFDAGPGIVRRAAAAARRYDLPQLEAANLDTLFITHLHSDHTIGLPDVMFSPWVLERTAPLRVYGPPGIARMTRLLTAAYRDDLRLRLDGLEPANTTGWRTVASEIAAGETVEEDGMRIEAIPVLHGSWPHAYGYRIEDGQNTIVISGDARVSPALIEAARGADILIHEVYSAELFSTRPPEWQRYHASFHTSTRELAEIGVETRPGLIVLTHQLFWGATGDQLVNEMRTFGYDGPVVSANDLDVFVPGVSPPALNQ